jgi:hypothetical protein
MTRISRPSNPASMWDFPADSCGAAAFFLAASSNTVDPSTLSHESEIETLVWTGDWACPTCTLSLSACVKCRTLLHHLRPKPSYVLQAHSGAFMAPPKDCARKSLVGIMPDGE